MQLELFNIITIKFCAFRYYCYTHVNSVLLLFHYEIMQI